MDIGYQEHHEAKPVVEERHGYQGEKEREKGQADTGKESGRKEEIARYG